MAALRRVWEDDRTTSILLPTLTVLFGAQSLRVLLPSIVHVIGERPGVAATHMGLYAFITFVTAFLAGALRRVVGHRPALALTAGGLAVLRLAEQVSRLPSADLALSTLGTVAFLLFLPVFLGHARARGTTGHYALGLLLGLALDTGIHGALLTYDLSWQRGPAATFLVFVLVLAQLGSLWRALRAPLVDETDSGFAAALPFLAVGPFLFLEALSFQNVAFQSSVTGWSLPVAFTLVMVANAVGLAVAVFVFARASRGWWPAALAAGLVTLVPAAMPGGAFGGLAYLGGQVLVAGLMAAVFAGLGAGSDRPGLWRTTVAGGLGALLFMLLAFAYYVGYTLSVPYENTVLALVAAVVLGACALGATRLLPLEQRSVAPSWGPAWAGLALLLLPAIAWLTWSQPQAQAGDGWPVRVMTYNLHQGFDTEGYLGMEALAQVIESTDAEVIALQEVSRGWCINGSLDMLNWLSQRLGMVVLWGPAADRQWGNAILTRYPVLEHGVEALPRGGVPMRRGFLWARLDLGAGEEMLVIATHLHHVEEDHEVRQLQMSRLVKFWGGRERTVIMGDFNAEPGWAELEPLLEAGLRDAVAEAGMGDRKTWPSPAPDRRIDYVWISPDLSPSDPQIPQSRASDHLGVAVTVSR